MVVLEEYLRVCEEAGWHITHLVLQEDSSYDNGAFEKYQSVAGHKRTIMLWREKTFLQKRTRSFKDFQYVPMPAELTQQITDTKPDALLFFDYKPAGVCRRLRIAPSLVWLGDLAFDVVWYYNLYAVKERWQAITQLPMAYLKRVLWKRAYRESVNGCNRVIVVSKSSEKTMRKIGVQSTYLPFPWPDGELLQRMPEQKPTFLFLGNLSGLGSRSGFHFLFNKAYPHLRKQWGEGGFSILLCGMRQLPEWAKQKIESLSECTFLGFVDSLDDVMKRCHAAIVPIDVPVGNRTRIVTCMARGLPIVAHTHTSLGNPDLVHEQSCLLASSPAAFATCMRRIASDMKLAETLIPNARKAYNSSFAPVAAGTMMERELSALIATSHKP